MFCLVSSLTQVILMFFAILTYFPFVRFPVVQVTSGDSSGIKWPEPDTSAAAGGQFLAPICPGALCSQLTSAPSGDGVERCV